MGVRLFTSRACLAHQVPPGFPERPERIERILDTLSGRTGYGVLEAPGEVGLDPWVKKVHAAAYLERFRRAVEDFTVETLDTADNPISSGTWKAALGAASAALASVESVLAGGREPTFAVVRPPGHHAERTQAMGFCFLNNVALMAERALADPRIQRIAIVDIDVHHGNGTQHLFEERSDVAFWSLHQYPFYPGTGAAHERGRGAGFGFTRNIPLPAGSGDETYRNALESLVLPELEAFRPDLLLVSAGFDAWRRDPLGGMELTETAFFEMGRRLAEVAARFAEGRMVSVLEGGYDVEALPRLVEAFLAGCDLPA